MFARIRYDINRLRNLDIYLTLVLIAILLAADLVLDFKLATSKLLVPLIMAFAVVLLGITVKIDRILDAVRTNEQVAIEHNMPGGYDSALRSAKTIDLAGVHHATLFNDHLPDIEQALKGGGRLRVLMVPPASSAATMAASRFAGAASVAQENERILSSEAILIALHRTYPGKVELKCKDYLFEHALMCINRLEHDAIAIEQRYTYQVSGGSKKPKHLYRFGTPWFQLITSEFDRHWTSATPRKL
jgi:hypothetical protein